MIDLDDWIRELDEQPDREIIDHAAYQKQLFSEYVIRNDDNKEKRQELLKRFKNGETLSGEKGLRKELAGLSTLFQTNFFRLFFRYCTGV